MFLDIFFNLIFLIYFLHNFFKLKRTNLSVFIFLSFFIVEYLFNFNGANGLSKSIILFINLLLISLIFEGRFSNKLVYFIVAYFIIAIGELIAIKVNENIFLGVPFETLNGHSFDYVILTFITQIINYSVGFIVTKILNEEQMTRITFASLIPLIMTILFALGVRDFTTWVNNESSYLVIFIALIIISLLSILYQHNYYLKKKLQNDYKLAHVEQEMLKSRYDLLNKHYRENFNFLHNLLHSINHLNMTLESTNIDAAKNELEILSKEVFEKYSMIYTNSPVISAILNDRQELIERNQIIVSTTLIDDVFDNLDISKQMEFFSIIIDVILESCISSKKEHKILIIKSNSIGEQNLYNFIFTSNDDVESIVNMIKEYILNEKLDVSIDFDNNEEVSNILVINHAK